MLCVDIAKYLDGLGYVNFFQTGYETTNNCFINNMPDSPDDIVVIYDKGGQGNVIGFTESRRRIQILIRNQGQTLGHNLIWAIYESLINTSNNGYVNIDGRNLLIKSVSSPFFIGKDQNGLFEWTVNFDIWTQND